MGDRCVNLASAYDILENLGVKVLQKSSVYESDPWGYEEQASFLNQVIKVETELSPESLVQICKEAEKQIGRVDSFKWGPRVLDVDVIFYGDEVVEKPECTIPHHLMHNRLFVLIPLNEIAGDFVHPVFRKNVSELLKACEDKHGVTKVPSV